MIPALLGWIALFGSASEIADREPTIYIYNGKAYADRDYWYGPGWYYGRWYGSEEAYWIWRRRYPYWWDRYHSKQNYHLNQSQGR